MTRRTLLLAVPSAVRSPYKEMAEAWNSFNTFAKQWADEVNKTPIGGISARAMTLAQQMDDLYSAWRKKRKRWEEGL